MTAGDRVGPYQLGERLGAGGMGVVYRATDTRLKRPVALKFLSPELAQDAVARNRFVREAQAASALDHPHIGTVHEIGEHQGALFIAMAFYPGETLKARLERGPLAPADTTQLLRQVLSAVAAAHHAGIVHRDLKPANLMLTDHGVKVLDFGLAKLRPDSEDGETQLTEHGKVVGTVAYMSPEQAQGEAVDVRSDLWSIGVIAYECLSGRHPFQVASAAGTLARLVGQEPEPLDRSLPPALRDTVARLLRKLPAERPPSARDALASLAAGPADTALPIARRRGLGIAVAGAALAAALAGALLALRALRPTAAAAPSLVALPCQVFGAPDSQFLTDAVPATLTNLLGQIQGIEVRQPPTRRELDPAQVDLVRVASAYGVDRCLTCTVTAAPGKLVIGIALVEPASRRLTWSRTYEGGEALYLELLKQASQALGSELRPGTASTTSTSFGSEAELSYRRGRYHLENYANGGGSEAHFRLAIQAYRRALELAPSLADAAADIALLQFWTRDHPLDTSLDDAETWARRALAIDPRCSRAWAALSWLHALEPAGLGYGLKAVHFGPRDGIASAVLVASLQNVSPELALEAAHRAARMDPLYAWPPLFEAYGWHSLARPDEALAALTRVREISPEMRNARWFQAIVLAELGRAAESRLALPEDEGGSSNEADTDLVAAKIAVDAGEHDTARVRDRVARSLASSDFHGLGSQDLTYFAVPALAANGFLEEAWAILANQSRAGAEPSLDWLQRDPRLEPLRRDPRYPSAVERARRQSLERLQILGSARDHGELPGELTGPLADLERRLGGD